MAASCCWRRCSEFPFIAKLFADSAYQGPIFGNALAKIAAWSRNRNRQTIRSSERVRSVTQALDRRTHDCVAQPLSPPCKGLENLNRNALAFLKLASSG